MLWKLQTLQKIGTFTLVIIAFTALWLGGAVAPMIAVLCVAMGILGWFWEPPRIQFQRYEGIWRPLTVTVLVILSLAALFGYVGIFDAAIGLVLYLTGAKLFQRERAADYLQALVLSFLLMAIATIFNEDLSFGLLFILYVLIGLVCFTLYHLRIQTERPEIEAQAARQTRLLDARLLTTLVGLAWLALIFSVLFFFLFPRIGFGYLAQQSRSGPATSGFSEQVDLGQFGTQKTDPTVIMRVEFPEGPPQQVTNLYWRGVSLDRYDGTTWTKTLTQTEISSLNADGVIEIPRIQLPEVVQALSSTVSLMHQSIYLEPIGYDTLFGVAPVLRIQVADRGSANRPQAAPSRRRQQRVGIDQMGDITHQLPPQLSYQYDAFSLNQRWSGTDLETLSHDEILARLTRDEQQAYLQLPESLPQRIRDLGEQITAAATTDYGRVLAVQDYLLDNFAYTIDLPQPGADPLDSFLFDHQRGHCEYFSTALAILLRTVGIPTRSVNGFWGGKWNENSSYLAIRNAEAHSWVEVPFGPYGWVRFDATPSAANVSQQTHWLDPFRNFYDELRFRWIKYVIQYDLQAQLGLLEQIRDQLSGPDEQNSWQDWARERIPNLQSNLRRNWLPLSGVLILTGLGGLAGSRRRYRSLRVQDGLIGVGLSGLSFALVFWLWEPQPTGILLLGATVLPSLAFAWIRWQSFGQRSRQAELHSISRVYLKLKLILEGYQVQLSPHQGPEALIEILKGSELVAREQAIQIIRRYMEVRFGQQSLHPTEITDLRQQIKHLQRQWQEQWRQQKQTPVASSS